MSDDKSKELFGKYRKERILKECPACSDLYHGYRAGYYDQQDRIKELESENQKLKKSSEIVSIKDDNIRALVMLDSSTPTRLLLECLEKDKSQSLNKIKELESELENLEKFAVKEFSLRVVAKSGEHVQKTEKFREALQSFRQRQKERGEK